LIDWIAELHGARPAMRTEGWRPGDQPWYVSDVRKISRAIGWAPRTPLGKGLGALDDWLSGAAAQAGAAPPLQEAQA
jgi:CDP-paratose 2-epimerase